MGSVHGDLTCPCCGYKTLGEREKHDICPICFWQDEPIRDPYRATGGPNRWLSLYEAQQNYLAFGAAGEWGRKHVRKPASADRKDLAWSPLAPPGPTP